MGTDWATLLSYLLGTHTHVTWSKRESSLCILDVTKLILMCFWGLEVAFALNIGAVVLCQLYQIMH